MGLAPILQACIPGKGCRRGVIGVVFALGLGVQLCGLLADHNRGYYLTQRKIEYNPRYADVPYLRVLAQLKVLKEPSPDLWWVSGWMQGSPRERQATCLGVASLVALLALAMMTLRGLLGEEAHLAELGSGSQ
jgi:hypothetical protein